MKNSYAPIVVFAYKRKNLLSQVIDALKENIYAKESDLYVFLDGYKGEKDKQEVKQTRNYARMISGFNSVTLVERNHNYGLARNIIEGVTEIVNRYGKIIVLEDDILPCRYFLKYMNDALNLYNNEEQIMEISGYSYPHDNSGLPETAFLHFADCWGWGTWKRAWDYFEKKPNKLIETFSEDDIYKFNFDGSFPFWNQVILNADGRLNTWAIFWQASIYKKEGLMLYPTKSLIRNIGFDGSGENCDISSDYNSDIIGEPIEFFPTIIEENEEVRNKLKDFFRNL